MRTSAAGLLLLLIGVIGLAAYVRGTLPALLAYLFGGSPPPAAGASPSSAPAPGPAANRRSVA